jgi:hypothetical protein
MDYRDIIKQELKKVSESKFANKTDKQLNYYDNKFGTKRDTSSVKMSIKGTKETRWNQTLSRISYNDIINAQTKHGNHQCNTMKELNISFHPYKKLCKHYGIELKKSNYEKTEYARTMQSKAILVYSENNKLVGEYYSVSNVCKELNLHKGNMLANLKKGRLYRGYYFKYKDTI